MLRDASSPIAVGQQSLDSQGARSSASPYGDLAPHLLRSLSPVQYIDEDLYGDDDDDLDDDEVMGFGADLGGDEDEAADPSEAMEALLDDEEEETDADDEEEAEISADTEQDPPSGCPKGFALSFLWLDKYIAFAVDQIFGNASDQNAVHSLRPSDLVRVEKAHSADGVLHLAEDRCLGGAPTEAERERVDRRNGSGE